jgi:hypothetical protein
MIRFPPAAITVVLLCLSYGCGDERSPRQQVRDTLETAAEYAGDRDLDRLSEFVSEDYRDAEGRDRRALLQMVALYFRHVDTLFLRTRIRAIEIVGSKEARATVVAAIADVPFSDLDQSRLSADFVGFDLAFRREGKEWSLVDATWESVSPTEYFKPAE